MRKLLTTAASVWVTIALVLGAGACSKTEWNTPGETPDPPKVTIQSPADGSVDVPASAELEFTTEGTKSVEVNMTDAGGSPVEGAMRDDGTSWIPGEQLAWGTQ